MERFREATEKGLTEITWDESDIQITAEDLDWDYVKMLPELLPMVRNDVRQSPTGLPSPRLRRGKAPGTPKNSFNRNIDNDKNDTNNTNTSTSSMIRATKSMKSGNRLHAGGVKPL